MVGLIAATGLYVATLGTGSDDGEPGLAAAELVEETASASIQPAPQQASETDAAEPTQGPTTRPKRTPSPTAKPKPTPKPTAKAKRSSKPETRVKVAPKPTAKPAPKLARRPKPTRKPEIRLAESAAGDPGTAAPAAESTPRRVDGWVCDGAVRAEDLSGQRWSVSKVSFLPGSRYERLVLHLKRIGPDSGGPASITAEAFPTSEIREHVPGASRPRAGKTTLSLHLADGVRGTLGLRGYRPKGLVTLKEFSAYPAGGNSSKLLVSVAGDGCFRLRAPIWSGGESSPGSGQVWLDVKS